MQRQRFTCYWDKYRMVLGTILAVFVLVSCNKDNDEDTELLVSMNIDGEQWTTDNVEGIDTGFGEYIVTAEGKRGDDNIVIDFVIVVDGDDRELSLGPAGEADVNISVNATDIYSTTNAGSNGTLTITKLGNTRIEGTFSCVAYQLYSDSEFITITDGVFKASFVPV